MADASWQPQGLDSDDEFENSVEARFSGKTALLVVIDSSPAMFQGWESNDQTPFLAAIKCCESIWRSKVVSNAKDLVSILLVGTEKAENSSAFSNIYELQKLSSVKVDMIQQLIEMRNSPDLNDFQDKIGSSDTYSLKDLFWQAKIVFDEGKTQTFAKKIMYFTMEDNPHGQHPNLQQDAINKFKDLGKVEFNVVTFKEDFQFEKFYSQLVEDESALIYSKDLDSLMKVVRMKQRLRRPICRSTLQIIPGIKIGIGYYSFVRPAPQPRHVSINKRNNELLERNVNVYRSETGLPVLKSEERKMVEVQGEQVVFTPLEMKEIFASQTGIVILGFLSLRNFNHFNWYRSPAYFLYPDENRISGSKDLFAALVKRCNALEKVPLVRFVLSRGRSPKLGCLIPSLPDDESKSVFPQGFHVFPIPFSDEMRKYEMEPFAEATPELISLMETVVKKLTNKKFDVLDVKNPALQSKWKALEEEALEEKIENSEEFFDYTVPNEDSMGERLGVLSSTIDSLVTESAGSFEDMRSTAPANKSKVDVAMEAKHGRLKSCTVAMMKEFLESQGVKVAFNTRKDGLISLVNKHLGLGKD